jgi:hypothetical protein
MFKSLLELHRFAAADQFPAAGFLHNNNITADLASEDLPFPGYVHHDGRSPLQQMSWYRTPRTSCARTADTTAGTSVHFWQYACGKNKELLEALAAFGRVFCIFRRLDVRADVSHRETLVLCTGAGRAFPEILLALVEGQFFSAVNADIFARPDGLACAVGFLFGQTKHQTSHSRQRYIWIVLIPTLFPSGGTGQPHI